jgi:hypothetical protein
VWGWGWGRDWDWEGTLGSDVRLKGMGWMAAAALERDRRAERAEGVEVVVVMVILWCD